MRLVTDQVKSSVTRMKRIARQNFAAAGFHDGDGYLEHWDFVDTMLAPNVPIIAATDAIAAVVTRDGLGASPQVAIHDGSTFAPPFDNFWVERADYVRASLVISDWRPVDGGGLNVYPVYGEPTGRWFYTGVAVRLMLDGQGKFVVEETRTAEKGSVFGHTMTRAGLNHIVGEFEPNQMKIDLTYAATDVLAALKFLNCRNIELIEVERPHAEAKAARKNNWAEPLPYSVVRVTQTATRNGLQAAGTITEAEARITHLRRGHFVTYRSDAPLFGKPWGVGTFWHPNAVVSGKGEIKPTRYDLRGDPS